MNVRHCVALALTAGALGGLVAGAAGATTRPWFLPSAVTPAGSHVVDFTVGDFNGDGTPDLAVASLGYRLKSVRILVGVGGGAFAARDAPANLTQEPIRVLAADFNADGHLDLAVSQNDDPEAEAVHVAILLGDGTSALRAAPGSPVELGALAAVADVSGDQRPDLVGFNDDRVVVSLGDGAGRFVPARSPAAGSRVAVADFTADGIPDLAVGNNKDVFLLPGLGSGRFAAARKLTRALGSLVAADVNGDGKADLAIAGKTLVILLGSGTGTFTHAPGSPVKGTLSTVSAADVNGDGKIDFTTSDESLMLLLGDGTGRFNRVSGSMRLPFSPRVVAVTDLNGDGKADVATLADVYHDFGEVAEEGERRVVILVRSPALPQRHVSGARTMPNVRDAQFAVGGTITRMSADGNRVAVLATGGGGGSCTLGYRIVVWKPSSPRATSIAPVPAPRCSPCCPADTSVAEFALGGDSVVWITASESGNTQGWHDVFAAKLPGGQVKRIDGVSGRAYDDAIGGWTGHLLGGGSVVAYNEWGTSCAPPPDYMCSPGDIWLRVGGTSLVRVDSGRRVVVKRGTGSYRLSATGGGRLAVVSGDGTIAVLAPTGARVAAIPASGDLPLSVALGSTRLAVVRWSRTLDLYNPRSGRKVRTLPLAADSPNALAGVNARLALLRRSARIVLVRLRDGRPILLQLPRRLVGAALTERGLFYAYNGAHGGRLGFEANAALLRRF